MPLSRVTCAVATVDNNGSVCAGLRAPDLGISMINLTVSPRQADRHSKGKNVEAVRVEDFQIFI